MHLRDSTSDLWTPRPTAPPQFCVTFIRGCCYIIFVSSVLCYVNVIQDMYLSLYCPYVPYSFLTLLRFSTSPGAYGTWFSLAIIISRYFVLFRNVFRTPLGTDGALLLLFMVTAAFLLLFRLPFRLSSPFLYLDCDILC